MLEHWDFRVHLSFQKSLEFVAGNKIEHNECLYVYKHINTKYVHLCEQVFGYSNTDICDKSI